MYDSGIIMVFVFIYYLSLLHLNQVDVNYYIELSFAKVVLWWRWRGFHL